MNTALVVAVVVVVNVAEAVWIKRHLDRLTRSVDRATEVVDFDPPE